MLVRMPERWSPISSPRVRRGPRRRRFAGGFGRRRRRAAHWHDGNRHRPLPLDLQDRPGAIRRSDCSVEQLAGGSPRDETKFGHALDAISPGRNASPRPPEIGDPTLRITHNKCFQGLPCIASPAAVLRLGDVCPRDHTASIRMLLHDAVPSQCHGPDASPGQPLAIVARRFFRSRLLNN